MKFDEIIELVMELWIWFRAYKNLKTLRHTKKLKFRQSAIKNEMVGMHSVVHGHR